MRSALALLLLLPTAAPVLADAAYKLPPREIVDIIDAPSPPAVLVSPSGEAMLLVDAETHPPIAHLAEPIHRIGGLRISAVRGARQRALRFTGLRIQATAGGTARQVPLPSGARIGAPVWSPDGKRFAFTRDLENGVELWLGDAASGKATPVAALRLNDVLGSPFEWGTDSLHLLARSVPAGRGSPPAAPLVAGPVVQETAGKAPLSAAVKNLSTV